jgi:hypothetical protein
MPALLPTQGIDIYEVCLHCACTVPALLPALFYFTVLTLKKKR